MKYLLGPFFKYLWLSIKILLQIITAILLTIIWGIPTLVWSILYFTIVSIWEFKLCFYKLHFYETSPSDDSITCDLLWSEHYYPYTSYFHCIWNIQSDKPITVQIIQKINKIFN